MVNQAHTTLLRQGATVWNAPWQELHPDILPDLNGTSLGIVNLSGILFNVLKFHHLCVCTSIYLLSFISSCSPVSCSVNGFPRRVPKRL